MYLAKNEHYMKVLDESVNYILLGHCEYVYLLSKKKRNPFNGKFKVITEPGDHYGDVRAGIIDKNERFCVTVGCGYIVYFLHKPFKAFHYVKKDNTQWVEKWNKPDDHRFFDKVMQVGDWEIEISNIDNREKERILIPHSEIAGTAK